MTELNKLREENKRCRCYDEIDGACVSMRLVDGKYMCPGCGHEFIPKNELIKKLESSILSLKEENKVLESEQFEYESEISELKLQMGKKDEVLRNACTLCEAQGFISLTCEIHNALSSPKSPMLEAYRAMKEAIEPLISMAHHQLSLQYPDAVPLSQVWKKDVVKKAEEALNLANKAEEGL